MTKPDHNNRHFPENQPILVLGDLLAFIASSDLAASEKATLISALRRTDQLIGHGALDVPADARKVLAALEDCSPAMAGMTTGSFANLKSRVRKCFRLAEPSLANPRKRQPLISAWADLRDRLSVRDQRDLSRFFHFVSDTGSGPERVDDALLERITLHLRDQALVLGWDNVVRNTIRAWNRSVVPQGPGQFKSLTPPPAKRTRYWIEQAEWPAPLLEDTGWLLQTMSEPLVFSKTKARRLKPATVQQYAYLITTLVSACRESGLPWCDLDRLSKLVSPGMVEVAMTFLAQRLGKPASVGMVTMMGRICVIAELCKLPPDDLKELEGLYRDVDAAAFKTRNRRQLTEKNRSLLDRLDDQQFCDLVITLPQQILAWAQKHPDSRLSRARARTALAIELFLTCSLRRQNLCALELGKSIKRIGQPPDQKWIIHINGDEVKNGEELRFELAAPTVTLLETYLEKWRPKSATNWLFPGKEGQHIDPRTMAANTRSVSKWRLGVPITPHQFRHISADTYLRENPHKLSNITQHLGHRDPNTARFFYSRSKQVEASRAYQETMLGLRTRASARQLGSQKRRTGKGGKT